MKMAKAKKRFCSQRNFWGRAVCKECISRPWPKCGNVLISEFVKFEKNLAAWKMGRTRKEERELYDKMMATIPEFGDWHWDRIFIAAGQMSKKFPETAKDRKEAEKFFSSLPPYIPLPSEPDETMAIFIRKKT